MLENKEVRKDSIGQEVKVGDKINCNYWSTRTIQSFTKSGMPRIEQIPNIWDKKTERAWNGKFVKIFEQ